MSRTKVEWHVTNNYSYGTYKTKHEGHHQNFLESHELSMKVQIFVFCNASTMVPKPIHPKELQKKRSENEISNCKKETKYTHH